MKMFKRLFLILALLSSTFSFSQSFKALDKIPHDIAYYRTSRVTKPLVKVLYGRPSAQDNGEVFGTKIRFNELWRTGANEATEVKIYKDVVFGNTPVKAGTYVLYTIPGEKEWEIILSSNTDVLGAFQYDPVFNIAKVKVPVTKAETISTFSIAFKKLTEDNLEMVLGWGSTRIKIPMEFNQDPYLVKTIKKQKFPTP